MFVHFINEKPVAISERNLFQIENDKFLEFKNMMQSKGFSWIDDYTLDTKNQVYEFSILKTKLFTTHENFDNQFYDLIYWLSGIDNRRDITKNFK